MVFSAFAELCFLLFIPQLHELACREFLTNPRRARTDNWRHVNHNNWPWDTHTQALVRTAARKNVSEQRSPSPPPRPFTGIMGNWVFWRKTHSFLFMFFTTHHIYRFSVQDKFLGPVNSYCFWIYLSLWCKGTLADNEIHTYINT